MVFEPRYVYPPPGVIEQGHDLSDPEQRAEALRELDEFIDREIGHPSPEEAAEIAAMIAEDVRRWKALQGGDGQ